MALPENYFARVVLRLEYIVVSEASLAVKQNLYLVHNMKNYRKTSSTIRTNSQNINVSCILLHVFEPSIEVRC